LIDPATVTATTAAMPDIEVREEYLYAREEREREAGRENKVIY
jgi:hypothetical protein